MSNEAGRSTFRLNASYHTSAEVRNLSSELSKSPVPPILRVLPPFYTDFGKNIVIGGGVLINAHCHFQNHGGIAIGDGCRTGHDVMLVTLNHELTSGDHGIAYPAPIVLRKNAWVGVNATILPGVIVGGNAVIVAGATVVKDVPSNVIIGGVLAKFTKSIAPE